MWRWRNLTIGLTIVEADLVRKCAQSAPEAAADISNQSMSILRTTHGKRLKMALINMILWTFQ